MYSEFRYIQKMQFKILPVCLMKEYGIPQKEKVNLDAFEEPSDAFAGCF